MSIPNAEWFKSSYSTQSGECVEVAFLDDGGVGVRDSKNPGGAVLRFVPGEWDAFTVGVKEGRFGGPQG
ncbi:DUF397 domain-containing protein [Nocardia wallacei]|uniref:DUF397 domain-containing protein n=1 Tax=Nocardia wallacei TaxID=480035 RepID=UPI00245449C7|nr:DUF397 domain-containing protein [Nocardia wallacei]